MKLFFTKQVALGLILSTGLAFAGTGAETDKKVADAPKATDDKAVPESANKDANAAQPTADVKDDLVVANVNGKKITIGDLRKAYENLPAQVQSQAPFNKFIANPQAFKALLEREVSLEVVWQNSLKAGVDKRDDVKKKVEECQRAMVQKSYLDDKVYKSLTDEKLRPKYDELIKLMPKGKSELMLRIILTATKDEAIKAAARLKKGEDFAAVAKDVSIDEMTKDNGGSYGTWVREPDLQQAIDLTEEQIKKLMGSAKATNVLEPVKIGKRGFAIFRIDDKRPMTPPPFEAIKEELKGAIAPQEASEVIQSDIKEAKIERFGLDGKPMADPKTEAKADGKSEVKADAKAEEAKPAETAAKEAAK
ncbi:MAG: peptidyl-prolyl cis-trans isomerase [Alphaproteobacteria bacterium]